MKIRRSSKSFKSRSSKSNTTSSSGNLLFSPRELKQMHHSEKRSKILKIAIPCLLVAVIGTTAYATQSKSYHLSNNSLTDTSGINSQSIAPDSTNTSNSQSSVPTSTNTSDSTNPAPTNSQTTDDSNLTAQLNAIQAQATASMNAANASANAAQAQDKIESNTLNAEAQAANQAAAQDDQAAAQDLANANNTALTPAEQAAAAASAARLQCMARAEAPYTAAMDQLDAQVSTSGFNAVGTENAQAGIQNQLTSTLASCNNQ